MTQQTSRIKMPELPKAAGSAYVQCGFQGPEYRHLADSYEPDCAMYSPNQIKAYGESVRQACEAQYGEQIKGLSEALRDARKNLCAAATTLESDNTGAVADTIWHGPAETLVDHLINSADDIKDALSKFGDKVD